MQKMHILPAMDESVSLTPAARVIEKCGGIEATAEMVGRDRSVVNRWRLPKEKGGTGGIVPAHHQVTLLSEAPKHGIKLTSSDFFDDENEDQGGPRHPEPVPPEELQEAS